MTARVVSIVQARLGGMRLRRKVLAEVCGKTLLERHVERLRRVVALDEVVLAIPTGEQDDELHELCFRRGWSVVRGSEQDVLARYAEAAVAHKAEVVVRTTADCPLIDPGVVAAAVRLFTSGEYDYVSNNLERTFPHGLDVEVFSKDALIASHERARDPFEREHVTEWIRRNQDRPWRLGNLRFPIESQPEKYQRIIREARITVDYPEDLAVVDAIISFWEGRKETEEVNGVVMQYVYPDGSKMVTTAGILWLLDKVPAIMKLNAQRAKDHVAALTGAYEPMSEEQRKAWDGRGE